ncbi:Hypothetical protein RG1141_CH00630 [Neorhizobium galegae bv. officinalis bv. officinalis str. HAMBI 1141]|uniref:Uncharacterized protein n=1 Tax=Neorhizobium galegae bv. officinalis bv. officinalis str. HAMBI 1141 TaxID=1028801 RepID=A0A068T337_NEOGA|nr:MULTISPECIES: hypothetical protein [Neorhizobium]MCJ9670450.1 hypothetical protein [Neorhizobium sp. SHOUNA12B]MCJ9745613.1 hypothetical protein [Neorhizobium sp. SHOUNA12A]MCJ9751442.1 hypothetical protein [Neorhizobium sp. BETTINA12A]CDN52431.1 Hypothetical protein RG1141_CH00630 [Neorhizobium galegae bv. officinalis bv. officinalis str. HAMBI 1141]
MSDEVVDLNFLAKLGQRTNDEVRALRKEVSEIRTLAIQTYEFSKRLERRQAEVRDDLELSIKIELGGALSHMQSTIEQSLVRIEDKVEEVADRVTAVEHRPS